ncbi:MAG: TlpA disulfide reductase family protein [Thermodesulfovibrionales bacterium]
MKRAIILAVVFGVAAVAVVYSLSTAPRPQNPVLAGFNAPGFELADLEGRTWRLSDLDGVVFVNFWATWCKECREEMPSIQRLYEMKKDDPQFHLLSVLYQDDPKKARAFMEENGYTFPVLLDPGGKTAYAYRLTGVPETFLINREKRVEHKTLGPAEWDSPKVVQEISALISGTDKK